MEEAFAFAAAKLQVNTLNGHQKQAVRAVLEKDVFVCLPTGFGKSLCFQSVPFIYDFLAGHASGSSTTPDNHIAVIVEPTAALMREQVEKLSSKGISAAFINHEQDDPMVKTGVQEGQYKYVYISPESLDLPQYRDMLLSVPYKKNLCIFVIDEAHCILSW